MTSAAKKQANNASFQAFANAYLKEIDSGVWHTNEEWVVRTGIPLHQRDKHAVELFLTSSNTRVCFSASYRSVVGRHTFTTVYKQLPNSFHWQEVSLMNAILLLIDEIYSATNTRTQGDEHQSERQLELSERRLELYARTIESHQIMSLYLENREGDEALNSNKFIDTEQAILFGHWLHPTPKSRQGMHRWQHEAYTPELQGKFKLHYFAAKQALTVSNSATDTCAFDMLENIALSDGDLSTKSTIETLRQQNLKLIAVHPLQAAWLSTSEHIKTLLSEGSLIDLGEFGPEFKPTSSVRTVYNEDLDYMVKLSIPVKVTNSLRKNMHHELEAGVTLCRLLRRLGFSSIFPSFKFIDDPAYITLDLGNGGESGFELILRDNPFTTQNENVGLGGTQSIAALVQEPLFEGDNSKLAEVIHLLAQREQTSPQTVAETWFNRYLDCAIEPAIRLFDQCGIALEAHQQNSLLDLTEGYPSAYYYRDNQGFYLSKERQQILETMEPRLTACKDLFYGEEMIINRFTYYLFFNQLFAVVNRLGIDQLASESSLLQVVHKRLSSILPTLGAQGSALVRSVLQREKLPFKANLLTRVEDVDELEAEDELAVYVWVNNPLLPLSKTTHSLPSHAEKAQSKSRKVTENAF